MARVQLALNVADLDTAIDFYSRLFSTPPAKVRPGYANFAVADPPLKLVLLAAGREPGTLNHLGVEVPSTDEVLAARRRLADDGMATHVEDAVACCYAVQDKVWVDGPDGEAWEVYAVLADSDQAGCLDLASAASGAAAASAASAVSAGSPVSQISPVSPASPVSQISPVSPVSPASPASSAAGGTSAPAHPGTPGASAPVAGPASAGAPAANRCCG